MNQTLFCLEIISLCVICGVADYISETTDTSDSTDPSFAYCGGNNWVPYKDEKCFKIIEKLATRDEAEIICNQDFGTDSVAPTLVSIKSAAEQEYLTNFVFKTSGVNNNVWIGAKRRLENNSQFVWNDGSDIEFNNWAEGSPTEESRRSCVEMQSEFSKQFSNMSDLNQPAINGRWKDVICSLGNWVLCQKLQTWSLQYLQKTFLDSRNDLITTINELTTTKNELTTTKNELINTKNELTTTTNNLNTQLGVVKNNLEVLQKNPIPIGFIYVQLPSQPEPRDLWQAVNWIEITSEYAGLFFRVLGGNSANFGVIQEENAPRLVSVARSETNCGTNCIGSIDIPANGGWSQGIYTGGYSGGKLQLSFRLSSGEVRPRNKAVRIWKRTK